MSLEKFPKLEVFSKLEVFLKSYSDEAMVSKLEEYHKAVVAWREKTKKQLRERFAFINEETHPIGTKSWLHEWRTLEKEVLEALG